MAAWRVPCNALSSLVCSVGLPFSITTCGAHRSWVARLMQQQMTHQECFCPWSLPSCLIGIIHWKQSNWYYMQCLCIHWASSSAPLAGMHHSSWNDHRVRSLSAPCFGWTVAASWSYQDIRTYVKQSRWSQHFGFHDKPSFKYRVVFLIEYLNLAFLLNLSALVRISVHYDIWQMLTRFNLGSHLDRHNYCACLTSAAKSSPFCWFHRQHVSTTLWFMDLCNEQRHSGF